MKRRDFLGALAAGATLASLPVNVLASPDPIIWNAETLAIQLESMFTCRVGPAAGICYFNEKTGAVAEAKRKVSEVVRSPDSKGYHIVKFEGYVSPPEGYSSYAYETYVCGIEGGSAQEAEARLAKHFYDEFSKIPAGHLVWRLKPHFESGEIVEYGKTFLTHEQVEDQIKKVAVNGQVAVVAYTEDGKPIVPADVELEFESNSYKYVERKYTLHKMRMRLVLPDTSDAADGPDLVFAKQYVSKAARI